LEAPEGLMRCNSDVVRRGLVVYAFSERRQTKERARAAVHLGFLFPLTKPRITLRTWARKHATPSWPHGVLSHNVSTKCVVTRGKGISRSTDTKWFVAKPVEELHHSLEVQMES